MAGTTVKDNDDVHNALISAMKQFGYPVSRGEANDVMGYPKPDAIRSLLENVEPDHDIISTGYINKIHKVFVEEMIHFYKTSPEFGGTPNAEETFSKLKEKGIMIGLDTGFSKDITDVIVERLGWLKEGKIDFVVASDEVKAGRPHPYMIQELMRKAGVESSDQVAKVGDTVADLQEGTNAKTKFVIGIASGAYTRAELEVSPHTQIIGNLLEVVEIVSSK